MTDKALETILRFAERIRKSPNSSGGEVVFHSDGSVTENRWSARVPLCADFDADCADVPDKVHCYLYDPAKGRCPYLSSDD